MNRATTRFRCCLDGFDITEYELGATSITPSTDALEEFKVLAGGMSAEYSLPSVINAALKSGSNQVHGSAYEYLRNEKIQARNFFAQSVPPLKRNRDGSGTAAGPTTLTSSTQPLISKVSRPLPVAKN